MKLRFLWLTVLAAMPLPGSSAGSALDEKIATLNNLVLREQISRYSQTGTKIRKLESFDSTVNVAEGSEEYSEVRKRNTSAGGRKIVGVWSFGEAVTMLRTTRDALEGRDLSPGDMRFRISAADRRWFVMVGTVTFWLDFEGTMVVSPVTGDIERIVWTATSFPREAGVTRIDWSVEFHSVAVAGRLCTVPKTGVYSIQRTGNERRVEWNVTEFSEVGRYGSESIIRFEP